jgi:hypothetical protein
MTGLAYVRMHLFGLCSKAETEGDDIYGGGVRIAARLAALTEPGSIYVSRAARDQVRDKIMAVFGALGEAAKCDSPPDRAGSSPAHSSAAGSASAS